MNSQIKVVPIETDVLIIGGGLAGCMAAIKAREYGVRVTIAEKANTVSSGCAGSGIDHMWAYLPTIHPEIGWSIEDLVEDHSEGMSGGLVDKDLLYFVASQAFDRVLDLEKFGINFRYKDSKLPDGFRVVPQFHSVPDALNFDGRYIKKYLTKETKKRGVTIVNRVMITDLLTTDGQVSGALGIGTRDEEIYSFSAKSVVFCTGRVGRLSKAVTGVWGNSSSPLTETGDGRAMALRAGLPLINMEFFPPPNPFAMGNCEVNLGAPRNTLFPAGSITGPNGEVIVPRTEFYDWDKLGREKVDPAETRKRWLAERRKAKPQYAKLHKEGKSPFYLDLTDATDEEVEYVEWSISNEGRGYRFLEYMKKHEDFNFRRDKIEFTPTTRGMASTASSGLMVNLDMETGIGGLFAAGDDVGGVPWKSAPGAVTMGWRAGEMAANRASTQKEFLGVDGERLEALKALCTEMLQGGRGHHWREVELAVQNVMDYYCGDVRTGSLLSRGIERLGHIKAEVSYNATNAHELMRCMEVRSLAENADLIMRSSLERKETRKLPSFVRTDFPEQDDLNWLAFLSVRLQDGRLRFERLPIT